MKTLLRAFLFVFLASLVGCGSAADTNFENLKLLLEGVKASKKLVVYEGVPRGAAAPKGNTIDQRGYKFLESPGEITEEESKTLKALFSKEEGFSEWKGPKKCGGFHPNVCLEWKEDGKVTLVLICFTCHEIKAYGSDYTLYCDLRGKSYEALQKTLARFCTQDNLDD